MRNSHQWISVAASRALPLVVVVLAACGSPSPSPSSPAASGTQNTVDGSGTASEGTVAVVISTDLGDIRVAVDTLRAPISGTNFLRYVDAGLYNGGTFFRSVRMDNQPSDSVRIEVIQGGMNPGRTGEAFAPIPLEGTLATGLRHSEGAISMARAGPDTATSSFFICIGDQPELDENGQRNPDLRGFAAFGRVLGGMDVVRRIQSGETDGQTLAVPITIREAARE